MKILLCIASSQTAPNISPISEIQPEKVVVAVTDSMAELGQTLITEIKPLIGAVEALPIAQESSLKALTEQFSTWLETHIDDEIIVNITGGTKLMSLAAYQVFSSWGFRCFYCDKDQSQLIWLDDESKIANIGAKIGLERYLRSYQFHIERRQALADVAKAHKLYARLMHTELCKPGQYHQICRLISKLNAHTAQEPLSDHDLNRFKFTQKEHAFLTHLSQETALFTLTGNDRIKPADEADRALMNGGWLEVLTADSLRSRAKPFRDISLGVGLAKSTQRTDSSTRQEIDVMAMRADKLVIIECKTKHWKSATEASEAIYKLSALSDIGGLNTQARFVSLYDLPPSAKTRAAEHNILVTSGSGQIQALHQHVLIEP